MKYLISTLTIIIAFALFSSQAFAGNIYQASMTGCTSCSNCKKKVVMSFAALEGVETVRFLKTKNGDLQQVIIETRDSVTLTPEVAVQALAELPHYQLKYWQQLAPRR